MARVTVTLPRLLEPAVGPVRRVELEAGSVGEGIDLLLARHPTLRVHLFDEEGGLRQHVLCFLGGQQTRLEDRSIPITEPTEVTFLQAVSGGARARSVKVFGWDPTGKPSQIANTKP